MHPDRITQIIRYALAKARREDHGYGDLGVIHLLKLLYLADLAYAQAHAGETFTGIPWVFFHFGPWERSAWEHTVGVLESPEIEPRAFAMGAFERKTFRFRDESEADEIFFELDGLLPKEVAREVGAAVHEFGADTRRLLHHVYQTPPMRVTTPGEPIDFSSLPPVYTPAAIQPTPVVPTSRTQLKKAEEARARLRESIAARAAERKAARVNPIPALNAKELDALEEITRLMSEEEDQAPTDLHGEIVFGPQFWQSDFRREHGLS